MLSEHKISKINRHVYPSARKLAKISHKLQIEKDLVKSTKEDLRDLIENSDEESDEEKKDDQSFYEWLESLMRTNTQLVTKPITTDELQERLKRLKEK